MVFVFGLLVFGLNVSAESSNNSDDISLTAKEVDYLLNEVGHTQEEIEALPIDIAKELIENEAELISKVESIETFVEDNYEITATYSDGEIKPMGTIPESRLKLKGYGYKTASDRSGQNKYYLLGQFNWLELPLFTLTDKMTIGFPESAGLVIPMNSSGKPIQHHSRHCVDFWGDGNVSCGTYKRTVDDGDWDPNAGVAASYDIKSHSNWTLNSGAISQYVYRPTTYPDGLTNVKFQYGHKRVSGSISVGIYPLGLGIVPAVYTDVQDYGIELTLD